MALFLTVRLMQRMRIDIYLTESGIASSRTEAKRFITEGAVHVDGKVVLKPSFDVSGLEGCVSVDKTNFKYVSRGGIKLEEAIKSFNINCQDKLCLDIGASSGGFTDCLLQNGAKHVIAVDAGRAQLVDKISSDARVTSIENYNARYIAKDDLGYLPSLAVMDVSFISATYIIEPLYDCLDEGADFICLIKPQFEVGRDGLGKGGIVKDDKVRKRAVDRVVSFAESKGYKFLELIQSPIKGGDGNIEFLAHFKK